MINLALYLDYPTKPHILAFLFLVKTIIIFRSLNICSNLKGLVCCCLISTQLSSIRLSFPNNILLLGAAETAEVDREANRRYKLSEPDIETERN